MEQLTGGHNRLCSKSAFHKVILATTMWDKVREEIGEESVCSKRITGERCCYIILRPGDSLWTPESNFDLSEPLIETANNRSPVPLHGELMNMLKSLPVTATGRALFLAVGNFRHCQDRMKMGFRP